ncbi:hypothetical protein E3N88_40670 [Mikania micrantha]|uniref:Uncharacterized protein n=1 Tax=Mikania micrantha TaxID=192012 RepID=A0A5N6LN93_9ASTR|nr:hypothetical protein E3N88_40670 [Mikania micrantha]
MIEITNANHKQARIGTRWCWMLLGSSRPSKSPLDSLKKSDQRVVLLQDVQPFEMRHGRAQVVMAGTTSTWPGTALLWPGTG